MFIQIDFNSDEAIYVQLQNQIIMGIAMDILHEGDMLPSVRQMADAVGINMHTVNKAYTISWFGSLSHPTNHPRLRYVIYAPHVY